MTLKKRKEVASQDCWNVASFYPNLSAWEENFNTVCSNTKPHWPKLTSYQECLGEGPTTLKAALDELLAIDRKLSSLYTYAHLRHDEDITHDEHKKAYEKISSLLHEFQQEIAWFVPELLSLSDDTIQHYLQSPILKEYRFHIEKIIRMKKHTLSPENEHLLALAGKPLQVSHKAFCAINDADFKFGEVVNSKDEKQSVTHALYQLYLRDDDRTLRKNAFNAYHEKYLEYENTLCELIAGAIESHVFQAKARHFSSCLDAALFPKNIATSVYDTLIQAVNENLKSLHRYAELRKRLLKVEELHLYDLYVPVIAQEKKNIPYEKAEALIIESVAPLGSDYQNLLQKGLKKEQWVDRYENQNKRSGAYSSGCYDSFPFILMNYKEDIRDVFTLAHEAGHSMHSLLSQQAQPYHYANYPIFIAEVASTFNEELLTQHLLKHTSDTKEKIFLINQKIEDIRATFFRQTMFAEFELLLHQLAEKNTPLTPKLIKDEYQKLNTKYFGQDVIIDKKIEIEWARIPHFYYNFYVFQYATGISAALALAKRVTEGGATEKEEYLNLLKGGDSRYPLELLKLAGVDMTSASPIQTTIQIFDSLVQELDSLTQTQQKKQSKKEEKIFSL